VVGKFRHWFWLSVVRELELEYPPPSKKQKKKEKKSRVGAWVSHMLLELGVNQLGAGGGKNEFLISHQRGKGHEIDSRPDSKDKISATVRMVCTSFVDVLHNPKDVR
jgi:hypothetical protein